MDSADHSGFDSDIISSSHSCAIQPKTDNTTNCSFILPSVAASVSSSYHAAKEEAEETDIYATTSIICHQQLPLLSIEDVPSFSRYCSSASCVCPSHHHPFSPCSSWADQVATLLNSPSMTPLHQESESSKVSPWSAYLSECKAYEGRDAVLVHPHQQPRRCVEDHRHSYHLTLDEHNNHDTDPHHQSKQIEHKDSPLPWHSALLSPMSNHPSVFLSPMTHHPSPTHDDGGDDSITVGISPHCQDSARVYPNHSLRGEWSYDEETSAETPGADEEDDQLSLPITTEGEDEEEYVSDFEADGCRKRGRRYISAVTAHEYRVMLDSSEEPSVEDNSNTLVAPAHRGGVTQEWIDHHHQYHNHHHRHRLPVPQYDRGRCQSTSAGSCSDGHFAAAALHSSTPHEEQVDQGFKRPQRNKRQCRHHSSSLSSSLVGNQHCQTVDTAVGNSSSSSFLSSDDNDDDNEDAEEKEEDDEDGDCGQNSRTNWPHGKDNKKQFNTRITSILAEWMLNHLDYPYPTNQDKHRLAEKAGITSQQVGDWMTNMRKRHLKPVVSGKKAPKIALDFLFLEAIRQQSVCTGRR